MAIQAFLNFILCFLWVTSGTLGLLAKLVKRVSAGRRHRLEPRPGSARETHWLVTRDDTPPGAETFDSFGDAQTALSVLVAAGDLATPDAARRHSRLALELSNEALQTDGDRRRVAELAAQVEEQPR